MPQLKVTPNPAAPAEWLSILGTDFARRPTRVYLDGSSVATDIRPDRSLSFTCGAIAAGTPKTQQLVAKQSLNGRWTEIARTAVTVAIAAPPPPPPPPPPTQIIKPARSVADILALLADHTVDVIEVENRTYSIPGAPSAGGLFLDKRFAGRPKPVIVRPQTPFGVTFDGGGRGYWNATQFQGADWITWDGFVYANGSPTSTGVIVFGGYGNDGNPGSHHIVIPRIRFLPSIKGVIPKDHLFYFSATDNAFDGPHDISVSGVEADVRGSGLMSLFNFGKNGYKNAHDVTIRNVSGRGLNTAIVVWEGDPKRVTFEDVTLTDNVRFGVRYENYGPGQDMTFRRVRTESGEQGWLSSQSRPDTTPPAGIKIEESTFG